MSKEPYKNEQDININNNILTIKYESNPIEENISYVFQRLVFSIISAIGYDVYRDSCKEFNDILDVVKKWISIYTNTKKLNKIDWNEFIKIRQKLFELDSKYLPEEGLYAEDAYEWILQLQVLMEKSNKEESENNGI